MAKNLALSADTSKDREPPKNIVLCSDGTGSGGGDLHSTNVWRLFLALDQNPFPENGMRKQVAFHDDGVGTESFKYLRAIGGAFGWGISKNLEQLYAFLVQHYNPGDDIYLLGFSRGAFTVRVLADMISQCGIATRCPQTTADTQPNHQESGSDGCEISPSEIEQRAQAALCAYKKKKRNWTKSAALSCDRFKKEYSYHDQNDKSKLIDIRIKCIGVWDTVDATGLPIDELTMAFSRLFPLRFRDNEMSPAVDHGFHALSIDDARLTFHPVLWDAEPDKSGRVRQVWFPGVHANVGGGYAKDQLSLVSLNWMIEQLAKLNEKDPNPDNTALRFDPRLLSEYRQAASVFGELYDSRSGVAAYFRYCPRRLEDAGGPTGLTPGVKQEEPGAKKEKKPKPLIHASVFQRFCQETDAYAPTGLPLEYDIEYDKQVPRLDFGPETKGTERHNHMELANDYIWWRRVSYYLFLIWTFSLLFVGWLWSDPPAPADGSFITHLLGRLRDHLPSFLSFFFAGYAKNPELLVAFLMGFLGLKLWWGKITKVLWWFWVGWFALFVMVGYLLPLEGITVAKNWVAMGLEPLKSVMPGPLNAVVVGHQKNTEVFMLFLLVYLFLLAWSVHLRQRIRDVAAEAWHLGFCPKPAKPATMGRLWLAGWFRKHPLPSVILKKAMPYVVLFVGVPIGLILLWRVILFTLVLPAPVPSAAHELKEIAAGAWKSAAFDTKDPYYATGWKMQRGRTYLIQVKADRFPNIEPGLLPAATDEKPWFDRNHPASPAGFRTSWCSEPLMKLFSPCRRVFCADWFELRSEIISDLDRVAFSIGNGREYAAESTGELFLYVNDMPGMYENNKGTATITISRLME
jgi:uncharacterized protein (DUF2235 family)